MIWYALYAAYEELEEWENAYTAAEIAIGLSPWFNYYSDYEGIGIHPYSYREGAKAMIEKQHEASQKGEMNNADYYFNCNLSYSDNADLLSGRYCLARNYRNAAVGGRGRIAFRA